ncbi:MAG: hypothetical protein Q4B60_05235 [Erysipelotrichaceae bacterium]|nr:hypothetical protein [Erysipelotrichaceae bacterium]
MRKFVVKVCCFDDEKGERILKTSAWNDNDLFAKGRLTEVLDLTKEWVENFDGFFSKYQEMHVNQKHPGKLDESEICGQKFEESIQIQLRRLAFNVRMLRGAQRRGSSRSKMLIMDVIASIKDCNKLEKYMSEKDKQIFEELSKEADRLLEYM